MMPTDLMKNPKLQIAVILTLTALLVSSEGMPSSELGRRRCAGLLSLRRLGSFLAGAAIYAGAHQYLQFESDLRDVKREQLKERFFFTMAEGKAFPEFPSFLREISPDPERAAFKRLFPARDRAVESLIEEVSAQDPRERDAFIADLLKDVDLMFDAREYEWLESRLQPIASRKLTNQIMCDRAVDITKSEHYASALGSNYTSLSARDPALAKTTLKKMQANVLSFQGDDRLFAISRLLVAMKSKSVRNQVVFENSEIGRLVRFYEKAEVSFERPALLKLLAELNSAKAHLAFEKLLARELVRDPKEPQANYRYPLKIFMERIAEGDVIPRFLLEAAARALDLSFQRSPEQAKERVREVTAAIKAASEEKKANKVALTAYTNILRNFLASHRDLEN